MTLRLFLTLISILAANPALSAVVYVDSRASGAVHDGSSWTKAYLTINAALDSISSGGTIWVREGVYSERITLATYQNIYGGFLGHETSLDQRVAGAFPTIIDAKREGRAIDVQTGAWVTINGLTIRNGLANEGGGIRCCTNANVKIQNCRIEDCEASSLGGGVYHDTYSQGEMTDCTITRCSAPNGGGLVVEYHAYPVHTRCLIARNEASISGGGLYCPFHSEADMINCTFAFNSAGANGGAAYTYKCPVVFDHCVIASNSAPDTGGVFGSGESSTVSFNSCDFYSNDNGNWGGIIGATSVDSGCIYSDPLFLLADRDEFCLRTDSLCNGIGAYPLDSTYSISTVGTAKTLPTGSSMRLSGKVVSCAGGDTAWIEETDRSATIAIVGIPGCSPGDVLSSITGTIATDSDGKPTILPSSWTILTGATHSLQPYGARVSWLKSIVGARVRTWGEVVSASSEGFTIRDGSDEVFVLWTGGQVETGRYVAVTGGYIGGGSFQGIAVDLVR
ncbi:MAG: right-handed parallel beta-helix repeat-containing protein [Armatimonadota bacterium]|nr:right-handed parallel beta-helix repeat-containing protein [bacterium]